MATKSQFLAAYAAMLSVSGLKVGDAVTITSLPSPSYLGDDNYFDSYAIGDIDNGKITCEDTEGDEEYQLYIKSISKTTGLVEVWNEYEFYHVPVWCLTKSAVLKRVELNDEYSASISTDGKEVKVGCQTFDAKTIIKLAEELKKVQPAVAKKVTKKVAAKKKAK